jgi:hypothetical protein
MGRLPRGGQLAPQQQLRQDVHTMAHSTHQQPKCCSAHLCCGRRAAANMSSHAHQAKAHEHNRTDSSTLGQPCPQALPQALSALLTTHGIAPSIGTHCWTILQLCLDGLTTTGGGYNSGQTPEWAAHGCCHISIWTQVGALVHSDCPGGGLVLAVAATMLHMTHIANPT